mmetsp:Transcript_16766/g.34612  ORF Transcript_16766/g.34612 Transcript_16766/m.34612 type:complete len:526 (-) Transcript_16766:131-1708(-)
MKFSRKRTYSGVCSNGEQDNNNSMPANRRSGPTVLEYENLEGVLSALSIKGTTGESNNEISVRSSKDSCTPASCWRLPAVPEREQSSYKPQVAEEEANRLAVLRDYMVLETEREASFDQLTKAVATKFDVPWAIVSFVDMGRQWFKSLHQDDFGVNETCREHSFCTHTIQSRNDIFVVPNTLEDERFASTPMVQANHPGFRFYAGVPLEVSEGVRLGTICILDRKPRPNGLSDKEQNDLKAFAKQTVDLLTRRKETLRKQNQIAKRASATDKFASLPKSTKSAPVVNAASTKHILSPRPSDSTKRSRTGSMKQESPATLMPRMIPKPTLILPDPRTDGIDPDTYLSQLVEAVYGVKVALKTGLELGDFFPPITEEQMGAYSMDVVTMARTNDVEGLKTIYKEKGRDALDCFNRFGEGLLNCTCRRGFNESVAFLLSDDVNLNVRVRDDFGRTPLHDACWNPEPLFDICTKLMRKDPSLFFITDKRGYTPFQYARKTDWPMWRQFLFERRELLAPLMSDEIKSRFS